jgi:hypothetical protein
MRKIIVGAWRDEKSGPMQVVSGPHGRERVHYEALFLVKLDKRAAEAAPILGIPVEPI